MRETWGESSGVPAAAHLHPTPHTPQVRALGAPTVQMRRPGLMHEPLRTLRKAEGGCLQVHGSEGLARTLGAESNCEPQPCDFGVSSVTPAHPGT